METVKHCVDELNKSSFYAEKFGKFPLKKFSLFMSLLSVVEYEKTFYKNQGEYTKKTSNPISQNLNTLIRGMTILKQNGEYIDCWDINPLDVDRYIIVFTGIGTEKSDTLWQNLYSRFVDNGWGILAFDYCGRGKSNGVFSQKSALKDAEALFRYLRWKKIPSYNIGVIGHSLGAGVALDFAKNNHLSFLVLLNPFNKASDMVKNIANQLFIPNFVKDTVNKLPDFLLPIKNRFNNEKALQKIEVPTLILHDKGDSIIPVRLSRRLYFANKNKNNITYIELNTSEHEISSEKIDICLDFIKKSEIWFFNNTI